MSGAVYDDRFFDQQSAGSLASARIILGEVFRIIPARSVLDVGCGVAPWLHAAKELGAKRYLGVDGSYVEPKRLLVDAAAFRPCDLERGDLVSVVEGERFDLTICVEVAEHLSAARAPGFVRELCTFSDLVLFSAAIPDQGGTDHVNEQWPGYWSGLFQDSGFRCFDILRPRLWHEDACEWWYLQNVLLFARAGSAAAERLAQVSAPVVSPLPLVHPRKLRHALDELSERVRAYEQLSRFQPFGRDEGIRMLERRVDAMRQIALAREKDLAALRSELAACRADADRSMAAHDQLLSEMGALRTSTSWRMTAPLRQVVRMLRRSP